MFGTEKENVYSSVSIPQAPLPGKVTITQGYELAAGVSLDIDFGEYQAHDFEGRTGQPPQNVQRIQKELTLNCTNISDGTHIYPSSEDTPNATYPSAVSLGNADVGMIIESGKGSILKPNDNSSLLEINPGSLYEYVKHKVTTAITAYPVSTTGKLSVVGDYSGVATMYVELD